MGEDCDFHISLIVIRGGLMMAGWSMNQFSSEKFANRTKKSVILFSSKLREFAESLHSKSTL